MGGGRWAVGCCDGGRYWGWRALARGRAGTGAGGRGRGRGGHESPAPTRNHNAGCPGSRATGASHSLALRVSALHCCSYTFDRPTSFPPAPYETRPYRLPPSFSREHARQPRRPPEIGTRVSIYSSGSTTLYTLSDYTLALALALAHLCTHRMRCFLAVPTHTPRYTHPHPLHVPVAFGQRCTPEAPHPSACHA